MVFSLGRVVPVFESPSVSEVITGPAHSDPTEAVAFGGAAVIAERVGTGMCLVCD